MKVDVGFNHDLASQVHGSVMTVMDSMSELYMMNTGVGNSFVVNLLLIFPKKENPTC